MIRPVRRALCVRDGRPPDDDRDRVFCGPGTEEVRSGADDVVAADCETVHLG